MQEKIFGKNWIGVTANEEFAVNSLTTNFDDNSKKAVIRQTENFLLYIKYVKGVENEVQIKCAYHTLADTNDNDFYDDSILDLSGNLVTQFFYRINQSGNYRIAVPVVPMEDFVKVSVRKQDSNIGSSGTLILSYLPANLKILLNKING